uniref:Putative DNA binding, helix-turn-helix domain containing protein n=1 Tax=viral metagenome TaxID=1070528 RepID=A0A6H1ZUI7_9ZZZZ
MELNIKKLEAERIRLSLKKGEYSKLFDLSETAYGKMLRKKSTALSTINKIASVLNLDPKDLLTN